MAGHSAFIELELTDGTNSTIESPEDIPDFLMAVPNINDNSNDLGFFSTFNMAFSHITTTECAASGISAQNPQPGPQPEPFSTSVPISPPIFSLSPFNSDCQATPERQDSILHWYGMECRSPELDAEECFQHDKAVLEDYIRNNEKLTSQLAFMKDQRKKRKTDSNLVQDYCFIVTLYRTLKAKEFGQSPQRQVSSKAILACLDVTASWLSRAKQVIRLLDKIGPDGTSPDPLVIKRLQSTAVMHKGSDLLTFLKQRAII